MMEKISSQNKRVKLLRKYYESSKARERDGVYLVEGKKMVSEADKACIKEVFVSETYLEEFEREEKCYEEVPVFILDASTFRAVVRTNTPQGIAAVLHRKTFPREFFFDKERVKNILLCERLQDPGNMGTIIRTAAASGFDALILDNSCVDVYNPKCVSASMSGIYKVPVLYVPDIPETVRELQEQGCTVIAAAMDADNRYDKYAYPVYLGVLIGNEGSGLSDDSIQSAKARVGIPMQNGTESLNAAVAAALIMYEVRKNYFK